MGKETKEKTKIKCPKCGSFSYIERGATSTLLTWQIIHKDGKTYYKDPNTYIVSCQCFDCGQEFNVISNDSGIKIVPDNSYLNKNKDEDDN